MTPFVLAVCVSMFTGCVTSLEQMETVAHGRPRGVSVTPSGPRAVLVKWSLPYDKVYRYRIERALAEGGPYAFVALVTPGELSYVDGAKPDTRLDDNNTYYYRIIALLGKDGPKSEPSEPVAVLTAPPPAAPATFRAAATSSRAVTLSWEASPSEGIVSYRVERATDAEPAFSPVATVKTTSCVDGGTPTSTLKDSTRYLYRVIAVNTVESESAPSVLAEVVTRPPPATVQGLAATSKEVRCVPLTWQPSAEADIVRYDIYLSREAAGPFTKIGSVQGQTASAFIAGNSNPGNLEDEGIYYFTVRAVNTVTAESADCPAVRAVTRDIPPEVQQVAAVSARPREVPLSWAQNPDGAVMGYEVWRATGDSEDWAQIVRLEGRDTVAYLDRGGEKEAGNLGLLKDGTVYLYKVVAYNTANVRSSASKPVQAKTKVIPATPQGLTATTNTAGVIRLEWQPNPEKDIAGYRLEVSKKAANGFRGLTFVAASNGVALAAEDTPLDPGESRFYRVRAEDRERLESEWSPTAQGRAKPLPDAPAGLQVKAEGANLILSWEPPAQPDITGYRVWSKKMIFGWDLVATTERPEYRLELAPDAKPPSLAVTAIDRDALESDKSETVKPPQP